MSERNFTPEEIENIRTIILKMFASKKGVGISDKVAGVFSEMEQEKLAEVMRRVPTSDVQTPEDIANNITNAVRKMFETKRSDEAILNDIRNGEIPPVKSVEQIGERVQSVAAHTTTVSTATNVAEGVTEAAKSVEQGAKEETAEMGKVNKVYVTTPGLLGLTVTSAQMTADYIKDNNIDIVNEAKEFIKNAPDTAVEAVNKSVDFVQEQATKGYEAAKVGTQKGFEILKDGVQDSVDFVKGSVNFVKDSLDYINPFTLNDTLNNAGQKVNPDATEETPIVKDNSKGMA